MGKEEAGALIRAVWTSLGHHAAANKYSVEARGQQTFWVKSKI